MAPWAGRHHEQVRHVPVAARRAAGCGGHRTVHPPHGADVIDHAVDERGCHHGRGGREDVGRSRVGGSGGFRRAGVVDRVGGDDDEPVGAELERGLDRRVQPDAAVQVPARRRRARR